MRIIRKTNSGSDSGNESAFMPMVDALLVILSIFFVAFVVLSVAEEPPPPPPPCPGCEECEECPPEDFVPPPISIPSDRYFDTGQFKLTDKNRQMLRSLLLTAFSDRFYELKNENQLENLKFIIVEGHADTQLRSSSYFGNTTGIRVDGNEELSYFRAFSVYQVIYNIMQDLEYSAYTELLTVSGTGSRRLKENRRGDVAENRRVEVHFVFGSQPTEQQ